ncbi:UDP-3-O-acyl-N-acetylglucosamine deacetylase [Candidatus Pelagibacter sp.]|nr:UDP-3-O-acyl-N-acetylglucosamine deacetylase [Candidatus Pelagibacter sp.]
MSIFKQKTINDIITFHGVGLHSGKNVTIKILPSEPNTGIIFKRVDLVDGQNQIIPDVYNVSSAILCTKITNEFGASVSTIEHLMGALFGLGIDNALIEIDNEEVPILDGSGLRFVEKILKVGFSISSEPIKVIKINKSVELKDNEKSILIEPSKINLEIDFEIKYQNKLIGTQRNSFKIYEDDLNDVYSSRTFCLYEDIEKLRSNGLAKGGSLDNAIVVKDNKILNDEQLRNNLEFVNHKILDCMGDLYLSGLKIIGKLVCSQGGHKLTNDLLRKLYSDNSNYSILEINEKTLSPSLIDKQIYKSIA